MSFWACGLCLFLVTSCNYDVEVRKNLQQAEALMDEYPDSSLQILYTIDTLALKSDKDIALYSLLLTQAEDKNFIDLTDDYIIARAVNYYAKSNDEYHKMLSYYYAGRVEENAREYTKAIVNQMMAEKVALELEDDFWLGMVYRSVSDIYGDVYSNVESMKYARKSYESFVSSGREKYINWALVDLARVYYNSGDYETSIELSKNILVKGEETEDDLLISKTLSDIGLTYYMNDDYKESIASYKKLFERYPDLVTIDDYRNLGLSYVMDNQMDKADYYMKYVESRDSTEKLLSWAVYEKREDYKNAYLSLKNEFHSQYEIIEQCLSQGVTDAAIDFKETEDRLLRKEKKNLIFGIMFMSFIIVTMTIIVLQYVSVQKSRLETNVLLLSEARSSLNSSKASNAELQSAVRTLFENRFDMIDELFCEYYSTHGAARSVVKKITAMINMFKEDKKTLSELECYVNRYRNDVMIHLRNTMPDLKDEEYRLFLFLAAGFTSRTICVFVGSSLDVMYNRKSRLKQKINKGNSPYKDEFVKVLC